MLLDDDGISVDCWAGVAHQSATSAACPANFYGHCCDIFLPDAVKNPPKIPCSLLLQEEESLHFSPPPLSAAPTAIIHPYHDVAAASDDDNLS